MKTKTELQRGKLTRDEKMLRIIYNRNRNNVEMKMNKEKVKLVEMERLKCDKYFSHILIIQSGVPAVHCIDDR